MMMLIKMIKMRIMIKMVMMKKMVKMIAPGKEEVTSVKTIIRVED